ncbi:MAG: hypothetical protein HOP08_05325 [Cyclobacteriaceae bacterium]|nr:hypothetical protein [Cyclobacteriaceae bacterium]
MKIVRFIFYIVSVLVICEVTGLISLYQKDATVCFVKDQQECPLEEDETREYEEEEDYFVELFSNTVIPGQQISITAPALYFELTEPLHEITVPPPQA